MDGSASWWLILTALGRTLVRPRDIATAAGDRRLANLPENFTYISGDILDKPELSSVYLLPFYFLTRDNSLFRNEQKLI